MAIKKFVVELDRAEVGQALFTGLTRGVHEDLLLRCCERGEISAEDITLCLEKKASAFAQDHRGGVEAAVVKNDNDGKIDAAQVTFTWIG